MIQNQPSPLSFSLSLCLTMLIGCASVPTTITDPGEWLLPLPSPQGLWLSEANGKITVSVFIKNAVPVDRVTVYKLKGSARSEKIIEQLNVSVLKGESVTTHFFQGVLKDDPLIRDVGEALYVPLEIELVHRTQSRSKFVVSRISGNMLSALKRAAGVLEPAPEGPRNQTANFNGAYWSNLAWVGGGSMSIRHWAAGKWQQTEKQFPSGWSEMLWLMEAPSGATDLYPNHPLAKPGDAGKVVQRLVQGLRYRCPSLKEGETIVVGETVVYVHIKFPDPCDGAEESREQILLVGRNPMKSGGFVFQYNKAGEITNRETALWVAILKAAISETLYFKTHSGIER